MKKDKKVEKGTNYMVLYMCWGIAIGAFVDGNNRKKNDGN